MRIAFFGGSFNPPHLGHLRIALAAADRLHLDRVLFAPVALQPLKHEASNSPPASFADRLIMLDLLLRYANEPRFVVSDLDAPRPDGRPNYTYDTLLRLRATLEPDDKLFLLTGADALMTLPHWSRALPLVAAVDFVVATRPGFPIDPLYQPLLSLLDASTVGRDPNSEPGVDHLILTGGVAGAGAAPSDRRTANFYILTGLSEDISATRVRAAFAGGASVQDTAPAVAEYVLKHRLYL